MNDKRILIVDDDTDLLESLNELFDESFVFADNAQQALSIIKDNNIEVVISDVEMPIMDGVQLMVEVHKINPKIAFIFMSGGFVYSEATLIKLGAKVLLQKPILNFKDTVLKIIKKFNNNDC